MTPSKELAVFFAEHGWIITSVLVFILVGLISIVGVFIKRFVSGMDHRYEKLDNSVARIDKAAVKLEASINAQREVCTLQHANIDEFIVDTKKKLDKHDDQINELGLKINKIR